MGRPIVDHSCSSEGIAKAIRLEDCVPKHKSDYSAASNAPSVGFPALSVSEWPLCAALSGA